MYALAEQTEAEHRSRSLIRVSEKIEETAHFMGPREKVMIDCGDRGLLPLSSGDITRVTYKRPHKKQNPGSVTLKLSCFDDDFYGEDRAVVMGIWGPDYRKREARGKVRYMGTIDLLPQDFVRDAIALLEHRGGVDIERAPWEDD